MQCGRVVKHERSSLEEARRFVDSANLTVTHRRSVMAGCLRHAELIIARGHYRKALGL